MKYYLDITLVPDAEINLGFLWQKVYQQLHLALVDAAVIASDSNSVVAVSFPEYGSKVFPLGSKLRLFSLTKEAFSQLDIDKWLIRLTDYVHCKKVKSVPDTVSYVCFTRQQFTTNVNRLARRRAKRKGESIAQALKHYTDFEDQKSKLPFVNMVSLSTNSDADCMGNHKFRLFISKNIADDSKIGGVNTYGLSNREPINQTTVPWF